MRARVDRGFPRIGESLRKERGCLFLFKYREQRSFLSNKEIWDIIKDTLSFRSIREMTVSDKSSSSTNSNSAVPTGILANIFHHCLFVSFFNSFLLN